MDKTNVDTYSMDFECRNCDHTWSACIPKGVPATDMRKCPNCGCSEGRKSHNKPWKGWNPKDDKIWFRDDKDNIHLCSSSKS